MRTLRYHWRLWKLTIHAGLVWGIREADVAEWVRQVRLSPLRYELAVLEHERIALTGRGFPGGANV